MFLLLILSLFASSNADLKNSEISAYLRFIEQIRADKIQIHEELTLKRQELKRIEERGAENNLVLKKNIEIESLENIIDDLDQQVLAFEDMIQEIKNK